MKRQILIACSILTLVAGQAAYAQASKEETIGVGTGAVVGAIAGGPFGFVIGAAIGAKLGDSFHKKNESISTLEASLSDSEYTINELELDLKALNRDIDAMGEELDHLKTVSYPELTRLLEAGVAMDLLFRTDEFALAPSTGDRFSALGRKLSDMQNVSIRLDGFADARGDETYNLALSEKRVAFVRDQLIAAGVAPERITTAAHGEAPAADETADSYALERRVSITLSIDTGPALASRPE